MGNKENRIGRPPMYQTEEERKEARKKTLAKYDKSHKKFYTFSLNLNHDADIITQLEVIKLGNEEGVATYIKRLIREDIDRMLSY